jgi:hypothetical protein
MAARRSSSPAWGIMPDVAVTSMSSSRPAEVISSRSRSRPSDGAKLDPPPGVQVLAVVAVGETVDLGGHQLLPARTVRNAASRS